MKALTKKWWSVPITGSLSLLLAACSSPSLNLPALSDSAVKAPGKIIWRDLVTNQPEVSQKFYENVFDWKFEPVNKDYSLISYQGNYISGMATVPANSSTNYWLPVMSSDNVETSLSQAESAGGKVLIGKTELKGRGDIAVIQDPQGAVFSVLDTVNGDPSIPSRDAGNWIWQEVWTADVANSQAFYQKMGNFQSSEKKLADHSYNYLTVNGKPAFGLVKKPNDDVATTWVNYVRVDDVTATLDKVTQNGGTILMAPNAMVRNSTVAVIRDPAGAGFVIQQVTSEMKAKVAQEKK